jgi:hypothetical protein
MIIKWLTSVIIVTHVFKVVDADYPNEYVAQRCILSTGSWVPTQYDPVTHNIRCLSYDGTHCLWLDSETTCTTTSGTTYLECGEQHRNVYGNTGYEDPGSWCSLAKSYFEQDNQRQGPTQPTQPGQVTRVVLGEAQPVNHVPEQAWGNSPDGNMVSIPYENRFALYYPNAKNYRHLSESPYFQNVADSDFELVYGWVPCTNVEKYNTFYSAGMWIFAVFPTDSNTLVGLGHAESGISPTQGCQGAGSGEITYKTITVSYSYDSGKSWTDPQIIISAGTLDTSQPTTMWSGAGDPGFIKVGNELRAYFYYNGRLNFARTYDPYGTPGSWSVLKNDGSFVNAINFGGDLLSLSNVPVGPNPHVTYSSYFEKFIMTIWEWGSPYVTFLWSQDGISWNVIDTSFIRDDILSRPLYPTVVSSFGSSVISQDGYLYYAKWSSTNYRTMFYKSIRFE